MVVILDNGHGSNTAGKCSPDKRVMEWRVTRDIVDIIHRELVHKGYEAIKLVKEEIDVSLSERCKRANEICKEKGVSNCILISVHINAAGGRGKWHDARGFSAHIAANASRKSKVLAKALWDKAIEHDMKGNRCVPKEGYIVQNLAMCRDTKCPAVLTENLFMDNKEDAELLLSNEWKKRIAMAHVQAIESYEKSI
jgi:N-acetylmuramoyl-L-alanine amidase